MVDHTNNNALNLFVSFSLNKKPTASRGQWMWKMFDDQNICWLQNMQWNLFFNKALHLIFSDYLAWSLSICLFWNLCFNAIFFTPSNQNFPLPIKFCYFFNSRMISSTLFFPINWLLSIFSFWNLSLIFYHSFASQLHPLSIACY